jgi:hypothetical protein
MFEMGKNILFLLILLGIFFSLYRCGNKEKIPELVEFVVSIKLEGEPLRDIPIYTTKNVYMMVLDTFLIVQTSEEKFFKIYSTRSYQLLGEFGQEGDGPTDFRFPHLSKEIWDSKKSPSINQIYDHRLNRQYTVSIPEVLEGENFEGKTLGRINSYVKHFYFKNENYLWSTIDGPGRFFHIDYKNDRTKVIPYIPKTDFPIEDEEDLSIVYRSSVMANEQKGLVVAGPYLLGQIDFFDMQGNYIRSTHFEKSEGLSEALAIRKVNPNLFDTKVFISDMDASEEFIYGLSRNNLGKNIQNPQLRSPHKILVFDWEGNPVKEYVLSDKRYVFSMAIDERNKRIYAYCPEEEEHNLVVYNYP